jgi:hypothetical protein
MDEGSAQIADIPDSVAGQFDPERSFFAIPLRSQAKAELGHNLVEHDQIIRAEAELDHSHRLGNDVPFELNASASRILIEARQQADDRAE